MITEQVKDKILGLIFGQALGDAYGLATEFMTKEEIQQVYPDQKIPFYHYVRNEHNRRWKKGAWTDDTDQMISIIDSFSTLGQVDHFDFAKRLVNWMKVGHPELGAEVGMGIGNLTMNVLTHPYYLKNPHAVAKEVNNIIRSEANGAIMRTCVVGAIDFQDENKVIANTITYAATTHAGLLAQASCLYATSIVSQMLRGELNVETLKSRAFDLAKNFLIHNKATKFQHDEFNFYASDLSLTDINWDDKKLGYALYCVQAIVYGLNSNVTTSEDFKNVILQLILQGGDCDSTGAVLGSILGCQLGYSKLPQDWIKLMPHHDILLSKALRFIEALSKE